MSTLRDGSRGKQVESLQRSINRRLRTRGASNREIKVDGHLGSKTRKALVTTAYLLGADKRTYNGLRRGPITEAEQRFVRNPGRRSAEEKQRGRRRVAALRKAREEAIFISNKRKQIVKFAEQAAANYRKQPGAYHYLAGGAANLTYLKPTPRHWRSDCSQFVAAIYEDCGLPSPASVPHLWASTYTMVKSKHARVISKAQRKPGDLGMYGSRSAPYHVEVWCGDKFIGHGSTPIDSLTPGQPDYYLTYDFLN